MGLHRKQKHQVSIIDAWILSCVPNLKMSFAQFLFVEELCVLFARKQFSKTCMKLLQSVCLFLLFLAVTQQDEHSMFSLFQRGTTVQCVSTYAHQFITQLIYWPCFILINCWWLLRWTMHRRISHATPLSTVAHVFAVLYSLPAAPPADCLQCASVTSCCCTCIFLQHVQSMLVHTCCPPTWMLPRQRLNQFLCFWQRLIKWWLLHMFNSSFSWFHLLHV